MRPSMGGDLTPYLIAEGVVLALIWTSLMALAFILYIRHVVIDSPDGADTTKRKAYRSEWVLLFLVVCGLSLLYLSVSAGNWLSALSGQEVTPLLANRGELLVASVLLLTAGVSTGYVYLRHVRSHWSDERIQYGMLLWTAAAIASLFLLITVWWASRHFRFEVGAVSDESLSQYVNTVIQFAGIVITATMVVVTVRATAALARESHRRASEQTIAAARQEIYQRLELAAIDLFRFECENAALANAIWSDEEHNGHDPVAPFQIKEYICQLLNLFEMAHRLRQEGVFHPEVFGSWVIWMWDLCERSAFRAIWTRNGDSLRLNYVADFRELMDAGVYFAAPGHAVGRTADGRSSFFCYVGSRFHDEQHVAQWLEGASAAPAEHYASLWRDLEGRSVEGQTGCRLDLGQP